VRTDIEREVIARLTNVLAISQSLVVGRVALASVRDYARISEAETRRALTLIRNAAALAGLDESSRVDTAANGWPDGVRHDAAIADDTRSAPRPKRSRNRVPVATD
jgi:hypothetical protein